MRPLNYTNPISKRHLSKGSGRRAAGGGGGGGRNTGRAPWLIGKPKAKGQAVRRMREQLASARQRLANATTPQERAQSQRLINRLQNQINNAY